MYKFRGKRSTTITTVADRNPTDSFSPNDRAFRVGNMHVRRNLHNVDSDSNSCSSAIMDENSLAFECDLKPSTQAFGSSVNNLLADVMPGETDYKRRSPSIIAKLMGLDGLPPKKPSENFSNRTPSLKKAHKSGKFYEWQFSRRNSEKEFKDVFEVLETPKVESTSLSSHTAEKLKLAEAEMAFIRQKFSDAKLLSTDEKLRDSKEFHDTLGVLDTNKDLLLKFLQQPDSLFRNHQKDLQVSYSHSKSRQKKKNCDGHFCHCDSNYADQNSMIGGKDEVTVQPTRIVVLKPNLGKAKHVTDITLQPCSTHDFHLNCRKQMEFSSKKGRKFEMSREKRRNFRESREIAKGITRQMRDSMIADSTNLFSSGLEGCAMEENSKNMFVFESAPESSHSFNLRNRIRYSSSGSKESPMSWEAKRRLSERWKMTHHSREMGIVSNGGSTLADMLASHDGETMAVLSDGGIRADGSGQKFSNDDDDDPSEQVEPLGISSRDGWKDECIGKLTRSRSLPSSTTALRTRHVPDARRADRLEGEGKFVKRDSPSVHKNSKTRLRKSHSSQLRASNDHYKLLEVHTSKNQAKIDFPKNDGHDKSSDPNTVVDKSLGEEEFYSGDRDYLVHEDVASELGIEAQTSSKETDQPSPVSILEPPFIDDLSSSYTDCFQSLSADLHGLRMQLKLLKLESEECAERSILLTSDEDFEEEILGFFYEHKLHPGSTWENSYLIDVLNQSALNDTDADMFAASWHSPLPD